MKLTTTTTTLFIFLLPFTLASRASSRFQNTTTATTNSPSLVSQCRQLSRLASLVSSLASNPTAATSNSNDDDPEKTSAQLAKAKAASAKLAVLQANATLVAACAAREEITRMETSCREMRKLERRLEKMAVAVAVAGTGTAGPPAAAAATTAKAEAVQTLSVMRSDENLLEFCAERKLEEDCHDLKRLGEVATGENGNKIGGGGDGDGKEKGGIQSQGHGHSRNGTAGDATGPKREERLTKAKERLALLQGNSTLVALCKQRGEGVADGGTGTGIGTGTGTGTGSGTGNGTGTDTGSSRTGSGSGSGYGYGSGTGTGVGIGIGIGNGAGSGSTSPSSVASGAASASGIISNGTSGIPVTVSHAGDLHIFGTAAYLAGALALGALLLL